MARRRPIEAIVIHHSAGVGGNVREFDQAHRMRGFSQIGYHVLIGSGKGAGDGEIQYGRPTAIDGAGVYGNNRRKLHIVCVGNFEKGHSGYTGELSAAQWNALKVVVADLAGKFRRPDGSKPLLVGHREITLPGHGTLCPGNQFPLNQLRDWYRERVD
jgi:N-acetylmuramoyl-L-alanine amidase